MTLFKFSKRRLSLKADYGNTICFTENYWKSSSEIVKKGGLKVKKKIKKLKFEYFTTKFKTMNVKLTVLKIAGAPGPAQTITKS